MDEFSYLSVLLSIILGLAVAEILAGFRRLLQARQRVRLYWPALLWSFTLLLIYTQSWWAMFGLRAHRDWTFAGFAIVLLQMISLYMLAGLILPETAPGEEIDLRANYYAHHRWFCGIALVTVIVSLAKDLVLTGALPDRSNIIFHVIFGGAALIGALARNEWFHKLFAIGIAALFALYIIVLFSHLDKLGTT